MGCACNILFYYVLCAVRERAQWSGGTAWSGVWLKCETPLREFTGTSIAHVRSFLFFSLASNIFNIWPIVCFDGPYQLFAAVPIMIINHVTVYSQQHFVVKLPPPPPTEALADRTFCALLINKLPNNLPCCSGCSCCDRWPYTCRHCEPQLISLGENFDIALHPPHTLTHTHAQPSAIRRTGRLLAFVRTERAIE